MKYIDIQNSHKKHSEFLRYVRKMFEQLSQYMTLQSFSKEEIQVIFDIKEQPAIQKIYTKEPFASVFTIVQILNLINHFIKVSVIKYSDIPIKEEEIPLGFMDMHSGLYTALIEIMRLHCNSKKMSQILAVPQVLIDEYLKQQEEEPK